VLAKTLATYWAAPTVLMLAKRRTRKLVGFSEGADHFISLNWQPLERFLAHV
jgi:hypothetical protein